MARKIQRQFYMRWHAFWYWYKGPGLIIRGILTVASFLFIVFPIYKVGWKYGFYGTVGWVVLGLVKAWRELDPRHMQLLQGNYLVRKLKLYHVLQLLQRHGARRNAVTAAQIGDYQQEVLQLIAMYVRDHRLDTKATNVFVNLLALEGDDSVVVARDRSHRNAMARYPRSGMVANQVFISGEPQLVGDLMQELPETDPEKPYSSILLMPVKLEKTVVGVVSIDSSRKYHFDLHFRDLVEYMNPYVCLLAWTMAGPKPRLPTRKPRAARKKRK